jgi:hypothetical protein
MFDAALTDVSSTDGFKKFFSKGQETRGRGKG